MASLFLENATGPTKLEEFVHATVPLLTAEGYENVIDILDIQRGYIEAHLKMFNATQENWHRFAQNLWNSLPERLTERVADAVAASRKTRERPVPAIPAVLATVSVEEIEDGPSANEQNFAHPNPPPAAPKPVARRGRPRSAK